MAGTSAIVTLLLGGLAPRLLKADVAPPDGSSRIGDMPLDAAIVGALVSLRDGVTTRYSDAPDIDFAATLARHDAALGGLAGAVEQGASDRRLRRLAGRLGAAAAARAALLDSWQSDGGLDTAWVVSGSSVPLRFIETALCRDLAGLPGGQTLSDFVRIAVAVRRQAVQLARVQIELGRDRRLMALATSLAASATQDLVDLEAWWFETQQVHAAMTRPLH